MDIEQAIAEGHVRSIRVNVFGKEELLRVHTEECPCDRCAVAVEVIEVNGQLIVREKEYTSKLDFDDLRQYGDANRDAGMRAWFVASEWIDIVRERVKAAYGVEAEIREVA